MKKLFVMFLALVVAFAGCAAFAEEADKPLAGQTLTIAMSPYFMYFETVS